MYVKICGITREDDAVACADLGATAIGLNFVPSSPRHVSLETARRIVGVLRVHAAATRIVGIVADLEPVAMRALRDDLGLDALQLHGDETPATLASVLPAAYKAVRIATKDDVAHARTFAGDELLVDARVAGVLGGSGATFDWRLVAALARERRLVLAGGLRPENVARAAREVEPWGLDVASGVERSPGVKDLDAVRTFLAEAHVRR